MLEPHRLETAQIDGYKKESWDDPEQNPSEMTI